MKSANSIVVLFLVAIILLASSSCFVNKVKAQSLGPLSFDHPFEDPEFYNMQIYSPLNITYYSSNILLNFTVTRWGGIYNLGYSVDGGDILSIDNLTEISSIEGPPNLFVAPPYLIITYVGNLTLTNLSNGSHTLIIYSGVQFGEPNKRYEVMDAPTTISFTIYKLVINLTQNNSTYNTAKFSLDFSINKEVSWIGYSLNGKANITITGNTTLTGLQVGNHSIEVYANDTAGNMETSKTISFTIAQPSENPMNLVLIALVAFLLLVIIALVIYRKKHSKVEANK